MKRIILLTISALIIGIHVCAMEVIHLTATQIDEKPLGNGHPKSPNDPPTVYIEDNTLYFEANHPEYVLNIKDEDGDVIYTIVLNSAQTQVVLPSALSGSYQIELVMGNWLFIGYIIL